MDNVFQRISALKHLENKVDANKKEIEDETIVQFL